MTISRRGFVVSAAAAAALRLETTSAAQAPPADDRFDPWIEVDPSALAYNAGRVRALAGGRPVLAVIKNNAYGLGLVATAALLEAADGIWGFAVVTTDGAIALRDAGIRKPILVMGMTTIADAVALAARDVELSLYTDDAAERAATVARRLGRPLRAHLYLDTGMSRMGMPYHRAAAWMRALAARDDVEIRGTFTAFTEDAAFDREQLRRYRDLVEPIRGAGASLGRRHAASSNGVFHLPDAHMDMVRPGIALFGGYPSRPEEEREIATLHPAFRLRARVVRVEQLRTGDGVSYGRNYVASAPTWIATLPVGHADGYPRRAVNGGRVLIGGRLFPVIGAVSASHTIVEIGPEPAVRIGDVATLVGPDDPAITPNALATATGVSVYDVFMHLNPRVKRVVGT